VLGLRIAGFGLGVGPLETRIGLQLARIALSQLDCFIGRDTRSCDYATKLLGGKIPIVQAPDLAMFLGSSTREEAVKFLAQNEGVKIEPGEFVIGVAIRRWFHLKRRVIPYAWTGGERAGERDERFERMLENISSALRAFSEGRCVRLLFFCMGEAEWDGDASFASQVARATGLPSHILKLTCPSEMIRATTGVCDLFLSVRMHSAMLAMSSGVPTAAICYVPKVRDFYAMRGVEDCAMKIEDSAAQGGDREILRLLNHVQESRERIKKQLLESFSAALAKEDVYVAALRGMENREP
jgi:polysaccharide pyruvyl transferase WcaK-like protein